VTATSALNPRKAEVLTDKIAAEGFDDAGKKLQPDRIWRYRPAHRIADAVNHLRRRKLRQAVQFNLIAYVASAAVLKPQGLRRHLDHVNEIRSPLEK
jgi:hypothetical protein